MVNGKQSNIVVGIADNRVFVKVEGKGTHLISHPLTRFTSEVINRGFDEFIVDLADCSSMDSTFLGVIAGIGLRLMPANGHVHLANLNARCREVVASLGIDRLSTVDFCDLRATAPNGDAETQSAELQPLATPQSVQGDTEAKASHAEMMIEAHRTLMQIDPRNVPKFKDCVRFLAEDLEKLRASQKNPNS